MCMVHVCARTAVGHDIPVISKSAHHMVMALRELYGEDRFYFFYSVDAPEFISLQARPGCVDGSHARPRDPEARFQFQ